MKILKYCLCAFALMISTSCARRETNYLEFLYENMSIADKADYLPSLFESAVKSSLEARETFPWGKTMPEDIFKHFVLPLRANNETLDSCRTVFYGELKDRIAGLSMYDAVLEVNHWCHEKATYSPSDARTSSPLATVRTALGRCGEESVLLVAALRSVCIPARQVYTPRWAHTDDNHAWVEAWVDGQWHYLGACEPEAKLDLGWFSSSVGRALLMRARVFGKYATEEDKIAISPYYTDVNVTANYTDVHRINVNVKTAQGVPAKGAKVEFKIYNYSEFFTAVTVTADKKGNASALFGRGNVLVWASDQDHFGYAVAPADSDNVEVTLSHKFGDAFEDYLDIIPPSSATSITQVSPEEAAANAQRLEAENNIRAAYEATFRTDNPYLAAARGNWQEIDAYLKASEGNPYATKLLDIISAKDLRDTPAEVLLDHLTGFTPSDDIPEDIQIKYILNPRISNEFLTAWRKVFSVIHIDSPAKAVMIPSILEVDDALNPQGLEMTPLGVLMSGMCDHHSRDVFFVAICRSAGIPARLEEISGRVQYWSDGVWNDVDFDASAEEEVQKPEGRLNLVWKGGLVDNPLYDTHFTISRLEDGSAVLQNFRAPEGFEGTVSWKAVFGSPVNLQCGNYMLTSGTRMASGRVLSKVVFFTISENETTDVVLELPEDDSDLQYIGNIDSEALLGSGRTLLECTGRGHFIIAFVRSGHEPSNHILQDILRRDWDCPVVMLYPQKADVEKFNPALFPALKDNVTLDSEATPALFQDVCRSMNLPEDRPLVLIADSFGRVFLHNQGYTVNLDALLKTKLAKVK